MFRIRTTFNWGFCDRLCTLLKGSRSLIHVSWVLWGLSGGGWELVASWRPFMWLEPCLSPPTPWLRPSSSPLLSPQILLCHLTLALLWPLTLSSFSPLFPWLFQPPMMYPPLSLFNLLLLYRHFYLPGFNLCWIRPSFIDVWSNCFCSDPGHSVTSSQRMHSALAFVTALSFFSPFCFFTNSSQCINSLAALMPKPQDTQHDDSVILLA